MPVLTVADLTEATLEGTGVFDTLMRANKAHLESEFAKGRIKGTEYSTVYLGSLTAVMGTALQFLLSKEKISLEAQILEQQLLLAQVAVTKAAVELEILQATLLKVPAEVLQIEAQTALINQQKANLIAEGLNIPKQGDKIDADTAVSVQQKLNLVSQELQIDAQTGLVLQQTVNAVASELNIPKEGLVLDGQKCKLDAEFDLLVLTKLKTTSETNLLTQKVATEKAQITALGVDADSVVGRQKELYVAQKEGFSRDAEQKAAGIMVGTWNARRMTNDTTPHDTTNKLDDASIGSAITKLLTGVGA